MSKKRLSIVMRAAAIGILPALTACAGNKLPASLTGLCGGDEDQSRYVFHDPGFAVRGATRKDQAWISATQETGIQVCDWQRPARVKAAKVATIEIIDVGETAPRPKAAPKKRKWWQR